MTTTLDAATCGKTRDARPTPGSRPPGRLSLCPDDLLDAQPPRIATGRDRVAGRRRRLTADRRRAVNGRIELVRRLIALNYTTGEIKAICSEAWEVRRRSVEKWLCAARARNRELLGMTAADALGNALAYWSRALQEAARREAVAVEEERGAVFGMRQAEAVLCDPGARLEAKEVAAIRLRANARRWETAVRSREEVERAAFAAKDRLDRMLGVYGVRGSLPAAPRVSGPTEPPDPDAEIAALLAAARGRETAGRD
jgi:hypothetical protein